MRPVSSPGTADPRTGRAVRRVATIGQAGGRACRPGSRARRRAHFRVPTRCAIQRTDPGDRMSVKPSHTLSHGSERETMPAFNYDVVVIGSGFGGSVSALRLTEKGYRVGVLEAGRRWPAE